MKWEYKTIQTDYMNKEELDKLGGEGWELVNMCMIKGWATYVFKRAYI